MMKKALGRLLLAVLLLTPSVSFSSSDAPPEEAGGPYREAVSQMEGLPEDFFEKSTPVILNGWVDGPDSFLTLIVANKPAIEKFREVALLPEVKMASNIPDRKGRADALPRYTSLNSLARLVLLEARLHESQKKAEEALEDYLAVLRYTAHLERQQDYVLLAKLIAVIIRDLAYSGLKKLLLEGNPDRALLKKASKDLAAIKARNTGLEAAFEEEKEFSYNTLGDIAQAAREQGTYKEEFYGLIDQEFQRLLDARHNLLLQCYQKRDIKPYEQSMDEMKRRADEENAKSKASMFFLERLLIDTNSFTGNSPQLVALRLTLLTTPPSFQKTICRHDASQVALELIAAAVSARLSGALSELPRDPFNRLQPVHSKQEGEGWVLYSIGPDGKDDSGAPITSEVLPDSVGDIAVPVAI